MSKTRLEISSKTTFPKIGDALLKNFVYFVGCGFLDAPTSKPNDILKINWEVITRESKAELLTRTNRSG